MTWIFYLAPVVGMIGGIVIPLACIGIALKVRDAALQETEQ